MWLQTTKDWYIYHPGPEIFWCFSWEANGHPKSVRIHWMVTRAVSVIDGALVPTRYLRAEATPFMNIETFIQTWQRLHEDPAAFMMLKTL